MWHVWGIGEVHTGFWWGNMMERGNLKNVDLYVMIILKCIFKKSGGEA